MVYKKCWPDIRLNIFLKEAKASRTATVAENKEDLTS